MPIQIWAKGTSTVGAGAESKAHAINVPITISGVTINPGDIVFSEPGSGVVIIPKAKVDEVLELLPRLVLADDMVKEEVRKGMPVQQAFEIFRKRS
jgi:regulator of RNase E activity RraA